ncbi:hypothetical protein HYS94_02380 [Candidatus Daviesbacteria bacterium]|nr:hypothetical protein [Candidatus Daviesbacteria bacterium]
MVKQRKGEILTRLMGSPILFSLVEGPSLISSSLADQAIQAAIEARWTDALKINRQILKIDPTNVDGLNRFARAYMELGKFNLAKKYYAEALKFDPYNPIAAKNLKIIKSFKHNGRPHKFNGQDKVSPSLFLQEPGKTKVVSLLKVAEPKMLSKAFCGMKVALVVKNRKVIIVDHDDNYFGVLPDDICHHLIRLIKGGNKYELFIKSIRINALSVLIKEIYRSKRFKNQPSFLDGVSYHPTSEIITRTDDEEEEVFEEEEELPV